MQRHVGAQGPSVDAVPRGAWRTLGIGTKMVGLSGDRIDV
jgi:hypothetical protein